jgi:hypothetical protein
VGRLSFVLLANFRVYCLVLITAHAITPIMASAAVTLSLDALVERYVAARGGREALQAITSLTFTSDDEYPLWGRLSRQILKIGPGGRPI